MSSTIYRKIMDCPMRKYEYPILADFITLRRWDSPGQVESNRRPLRPQLHIHYLLLSTL